MRAISDMEIIQIDITNACHRTCSNCTRFCGHHRKPFFMDMATFRKAVDSLVDFPGMVGVIGGEPLLHPGFAEMALYLQERIPEKRRRGLWSTIPQHRTKHAEVIREVFGHLNLNDHSIDRILHQPVLVAAEEIVPDPVERNALIDKCWVQMLWSASITPKGAFFCEVAAAMSHLYQGSDGWPIEPGWWKRTPVDFASQRDEYCHRCGCAMPLKRRRSTENVDDVSPGNFERLVQLRSPKVRKGLVEVNVTREQEVDWKPSANWYMSEVPDELGYRQRVANRIGLDDIGDANVYFGPSPSTTPAYSPSAEPVHPTPNVDCASRLAGKSPLRGGAMRKILERAVGEGRRSIRPPPTIWVVVTCMGRLSFLKTTAPTFLRHAQIKYCLVDYSCPDRSGDWFAAQFPDALEEQRAAVVRVEGQPYFEKSKALNAGALCAIGQGADYLCFADVDTIAHDGFGAWVANHARADRFIIAGSLPNGYDVASLMGFVVMPASVYVASGGYDEEMLGWGGEDIDMRFRLHLHQKLRYRRMPLELLGHLEHGDDLRIKHHILSLSESNVRNTMRAVRRVREWTGRDLCQLDAETRRLEFWVPGAAGPLDGALVWRRDLHAGLLRRLEQASTRSSPAASTVTSVLT
jgi:glycosyl transferase family 7 (putative galactosyltransferase)